MNYIAFFIKWKEFIKKFYTGGILLGEERREYIINLIKKTGSISAIDIAKTLEVSETTIRRIKRKELTIQKSTGKKIKKN